MNINSKDIIRLLLNQGYDIKALVRNNSCLDNLTNLDLEIVRGDLNQENLAQQMNDCEILFHVAAQYSLWQKPHLKGCWGFR